MEALLFERHIRGDIDLPAQALKAPHHGSDSSSTDRFLDTVQPEIAVMSAGAHNFYGHPSPEVIRRYDDRGLRLYRTNRDGAGTLQSDCRGCWIRTVRR